MVAGGAVSLDFRTLCSIGIWTLSVVAPTLLVSSCKVFDPSLVDDGDDDGTDDNGAECVPEQAEVCNDVDDDCDDDIDEDFDLLADENNCGACGRVCTFAQATGECTAGVCANACLEGWKDCNEQDADGCEANLDRKGSCGDCGLTCPFTCSAANCVTGAGVAAGRTWTCLTMSSGGVRCWGSNNTGQLGSGNTASSSMPRDVVSLDDARQIRLGFGHSCALRDGRVASCWGQNDRGQVGDGTTAQQTAPVPVVMGNVDDIAVGFAHTCARSGDRLHCWGFNDAGQLGLGDEVHRPLPTLVPAKATGDIVDMAVGLAHTCAVRATGEVVCMGFNDQGQAGMPINAPLHVLEPVVVQGIADAVQISLGHAHGCVVTTTGGVRCWGWNGLGQLGDGSFVSRPAPSDVVDDTGVALSGIERVIAGPIRTCALTGDGQAYCWGDNTEGALGAGKSSPQHPRALPVQLEDVRTILDIAVGEKHTCFLGGLGIRCLGENQEGQLGDGSTIASRTGVDVAL